MSMQTSAEEYALALRLGQREAHDLIQSGRSPHPAVLDELLPEHAPEMVQDLGLMEIPAERIIGTKTAGRIAAFTPSFRPLLDSKSEFARKWIALCEAHLESTGIHDPISCFEYLGNFYVQEGNKRVSVLRHFGAPRIPAEVRRILPPVSDEPRIKAYYEFLDFYKATRLYVVQFRRPNDYGKLLQALEMPADQRWNADQRRCFQNYFHYFTQAFSELNTKNADVLPEEALLVWLQVHSFADLGTFSASELKKSLADMWPVILSAGTDGSVKVQTEPEKEDGKPGILGRFTIPSHLRVAFIHQMTPAASVWTLGHEKGVEHVINAFGDDRLSARSYYDANTPELAAEKIGEAIAEGAQIVFTTSPLLRPAALKASVKYPKVQFFNCSVDQPYSTLRSYYGRIYEAKFITGAIAGALSMDDRIGYIASYPILGEPASINAFALGAQLTNPSAQVELRWSCVKGSPLADFLSEGIRVISNRDAPTQSTQLLDFCTYGTYLMDDRGGLVPLASPVWVWGRFYEMVLGSIFSGSWRSDKNNFTALNYWLGMDSGLIDISFSQKLPEGTRRLALFLRDGLKNKTIDPFLRRIIAQDGTVKNDGSAPFTVDQVLHMDWLCENVIGSIPTFQEILPISQPMVRELGLCRDRLASGKEVQSHEDPDHIR